MSTSGRSSPGRKPRRPRVAGLRGRTSQDAVSYQPADSDGTTPANGASGSDTTEPDTPAHEVWSGEESGSRSTIATREQAPDVEGPTVEEHTRAEESAVGTAGTAALTEPVDDLDTAVQEGDTAEASTAEGGTAEAESGEDAAESPAKSGPSWLNRRRKSVVSALLAATVVFVGLAVWFYTEMYSLRFEGPAANEALVDSAATSAVNGQVSNAIQQVFSYDFANTAKTDNAAKTLLVGPAIQQYNQLFGTVKQLAPQEKMVLSTTVTASGVTRLQGDRAQVLVFVNQNAVRTDTGQNNSGSGQISIDAVQQGNQWKIDQITER